MLPPHLSSRLALALAAIAACGFAGTAAAEAANPAAYIFSPQVEAGMREIDSKAGLARDRQGRSYWAASLGLEYGFTDWWAAEATLNFGRAVGEQSAVDSLEWENRFQLTPNDGGPWVIGLLFEVERARERGEGWELRYGPLLQRRWGEQQLNLNLLFERRLRAEAAQAPTRFGYQWQWRGQREAAFDIGLQGFGDLGRWDHWASRRGQSHILGPTLFLQLGDDEDDPAVEIGLLLGTGGASPKQTLRLQAMVPF